MDLIVLKEELPVGIQRFLLLLAFAAQPFASGTLALWQGAYKQAEGLN